MHSPLKWSEQRYLGGVCGRGVALKRPSSFVQVLEGLHNDLFPVAFKDSLPEEVRSQGHCMHRHFTSLAPQNSTACTNWTVPSHMRTHSLNWFDGCCPLTPSIARQPSKWPAVLDWQSSSAV